MEKGRPLPGLRALEGRRAVALDKILQGKRPSSRSGGRSQEEDCTEERSPSLYPTKWDVSNMQRLDQLLSRLGTLADDVQSEKSADTGRQSQGESKNRCTDLINKFCSLETLLKDHAQKDIQRNSCPTDASIQLPRRHDHDEVHNARPNLVTQEKKPTVSSNISVDTRLENAIEQLMQATKNHLLDKKMEVQRMEDTLERALKELDTVKSHEEQLLTKRFSYLETQYRERASQLEEEFALRTAELRQSAVAQLNAFKQKGENAVLGKVESLLLELNGKQALKSGGPGKLTAAASYLQSRLNQTEDNTPYFNHEGLYCSRSHESSIDEDAGQEGERSASPQSVGRLPSERVAHRDPNVVTSADMEEVLSKTHAALEDRLKTPKSQLKSSKLLFRPIRVSFGPSRTEELQGEGLHLSLS